MTNGIGSGGVQLSDVYQDDSAKNEYARLFRKHNGFSPDKLLKAKQLGNEIREKAFADKIDRLTKEESATIEADQYVRKLMTTAKALSNPRLAILHGEKDAFGARTATLSSSTPDIDANNIVLVTPSFGAAEGSMSIKVNRIATKDKTLGTETFTSPTTNITAHETRIYIRGTEIKVPANATLDEIVGAINAKKTDTHIQSFARKFSDTDYRLFMSNAKEGEKITFETVVNKLTESFANHVTPLNLAGTLAIGGQEKIITPAMSLTDIATLISTVPTFAATVSGLGPYTLAVTENAVPVALTDPDVATEKMMDQLGLKESLTTADLLKAEYLLDGDPTPLHSTTNHIEGLYHKTTIDLLAPSAGAEITASIGRDPIEVLNCIDDFIEAYNSLIKFADTQTAKDSKNDYKPKEGAYLANNRQFIGMIDRIKKIYSNTLTRGVTGLNHVSEIGIKRDENGLLVKDQKKLADKLDSNLDGVEQIFAFISNNTTGGYFQTISHPKQLPSEIFEKDIMVSVIKNSEGHYAARLYLETGGVISQDTSIDIGNENIQLHDAGKISLIGPADTIYEGFKFYYSGPEMPTPTDPETNTETQGFRVSQGLGDLFSGKLSDIVLLQINSDAAADQTNELNKISYQARKQKLLQEKKFEELKAKHARTMQREKRKAEKYQRDMEEVQELMAAFSPMMAGMFG
ncbi:flagellar filament capping protein FliD [Candidatus Bodocaedibacter vickermanii]|uniref:Flagellar hook protein FliD n=1 Tax=Candidatus Bodocaedibacter vickermanii TaxID=2741701 RepID=A0A7L9RTC8_9PROT|nr:flagellar hook protein FliD [Candidatus Paracaedibacteraceae bacterium 'Lake Konstanz']